MNPGPTLEVRSPIDDQVVGKVAAMTTAAADAAVDLVATAQADWAARPPAERFAILETMAATLRQQVDELAESLVREVGKTPAEAHDEITRSADLIDFTVAEAGRLGDYTIKSEAFPGVKAGRVQTVTRVPVGVVLAIAPFNYPVNLSVSKIAPALAMGNTVLFKPPTQGSVTAGRLVESWQAAGLPPEILAVVTGSGKEIGDHLVTHPSVNLINMTGSQSVGERIAAQAGMIPLLLELGGNDPAIVLGDADREVAAENIAKGAFKYAGQRCTAVKRVLVVESIADKFVEHLASKVSQLFGSVGDPREHPVGPVIDDKQADFVGELLADAVKRGGQVVIGGKREGRMIEATVVDRVPADARLAREEQFGPVLPIVRVADADEAVRLANDSPYGLQASVFSQATATAQAVAQRLQAGGVHLNGPDQRGPDNFLFVGHKKSGLGPQGVRFSLEQMSLLKGIVDNR